jgi:hypothetical protein
MVQRLVEKEKLLVITISSLGHDRICIGLPKFYGSLGAKQFFSIRGDLDFGKEEKEEGDGYE